MTGSKHLSGSGHFGKALQREFVVGSRWSLDGSDRRVPVAWRKRGTIERGNSADFEAVPGDPILDIGQTERVFFVMNEGEIVRNARS
jgi:hypothetical protein